MFFDVSEEMVAAWIDGTLSDENEAAFMEQLSSNSELAAILDAYDDIEEEFENIIESGYDLSEEISFDDFELPAVDTIEAGLPEDFNLDDEDDSDFSEDSDNHNYYDYSGSHDVAGNDESSESCEIPEDADELSSSDDESNDISDFF